MDTYYKRELNFGDKYSYTVEFIKEEDGYLVLRITVPNSSSKDYNNVGIKNGISEIIVDGVEYKPDDLRFKKLFGYAYFIPFKGKSAIVKIKKFSSFYDKISFEKYFFYSGTYKGKYSNGKPKSIYIFAIIQKNIDDK